MKVFARAFTAGMVALTLAGCAGESPSGPQLHWTGESEAGFTVRDSKPGHPYSFGALTFCIDRPGQVTIQKAEAEGGAGTVVIERFAIRPGPTTTGEPMLGADRKPLSALGFGDRPADVSEVCPSGGAQPAGDRDAFVELGLQYSKTVSDSVKSTAVVLTYLSGGRRRQLRVPFFVTLCAPGDTVGICAR